jgi:hypothetical protein
MWKCPDCDKELKAAGSHPATHDFVPMEAGGESVIEVTGNITEYVIGKDGGIEKVEVDAPIQETVTLEVTAEPDEPIEEEAVEVEGDMTEADEVSVEIFETSDQAVAAEVAAIPHEVATYAVLEGDGRLEVDVPKSKEEEAAAQKELSEAEKLRLLGKALIANEDSTNDENLLPQAYRDPDCVDPYILPEITLQGCPKCNVTGQLQLVEHINGVHAVYHCMQCGKNHGYNTVEQKLI